ncbi:MAG: penicillin-binding protein 2 [Candidatus Firestonebacteria bacterium]|nr:penicillin-binding protein 2 [Candidatus Firestonebacteria bacterium]
MLWDHFLLRKEEEYRKRIQSLGIFLLIGFGLVLLRLIYLQLLQGNTLFELSARNRERLIPIKAQRGLIYDRNGELLAGNVPAFNVSLIPASLPTDPAARQQECALLQKLLALDDNEVEEKINRRRYRYFEPLRLKGNLDRVTAALMEEHKPELPGMMVLTESQRHYKNETLAFHALGYVGEISEHDLALREGYQAGDIVGQAGVEKMYDHYLKGRNGWLHIEVDAHGRQLGILGKEDPWTGHSLVLSLDAKLQAAAEKILNERRGVIIVEDVRNGEIRALASSPTYNPNTFARGIPKDDWNKLLADRDFPLTNRAIQGLYPPGSLFKIVTVAGALQEKLIDAQESFQCKGVYWISTWPYRCWNDSGHGQVEARRSLIESCDIYYYQVGLRLKVDKLGEWAKRFGYGTPTGIDLPNEISGLVPTPQWKERTQNMPWFPGNTVMMSIGQGYMMATPMQMLGSMCAAANGGIVYRPHLLHRVLSASGRVIHEVNPEVMIRVGAGPEVWALIQKSLTDVVNSKRGTGKQAHLEYIKVAGKTATAQNPHGEDHAAFAAFAPAEKPEIAVLVYLENAGGGGAEAAPLARKVMEAYFGIASGEMVEKK